MRATRQLVDAECKFHSRRCCPALFRRRLAFLEFVVLYVLFVEIVLLALLRKPSSRILETLFPIFRRCL
jgi:hypothetical protein